MATLVLTAVGGVLGGPIGAAIGATLGNAFDRNVLFAPPRREGPRLTDLAVQTSSYGAPIARLFGTMRVAGSVIWATDLIERRSESGGGKGRPGSVTYSYSASFAVLLSARPILSVGRIWADGKLLRGSSGDWKARTGFRLHTGSEDQAVDPLIAAAEGAERTPAQRGCAYAVFEELELADFGNRIPSLTFEVTADAGPVALGALATAIGAGAVVADDAGPAIGGYSAWGTSRRAAIETLAAAGGGWFGSGAPLRYRTGTEAAPPEIADAGMAAGARRGARRLRSIVPLSAVPRTLAIAHHDPARDYQIGEQRATRPGAGAREQRIDLPAAIDAGAARTLAHAALARAEAERERRTVTLDWQAIGIAPGDRVRIAGEAGQWRVTRAAIEAFVVRLELVRIAAASLPQAADPGRVLGAADRVAGETRLAVFDLPPIGEALAGAPTLAIAAAGTGSGWRSAALSISTDGGASWRDIGMTAAPAVLGIIESPPGSADPAIEDRRSAVVVELANDAMMLMDAATAALDAGANLAMIGDEAVQFGRAEPLGGARWRLSRFWRGRRGTESAMGTQAAGDRFALIAPGTLVTEALAGLAPGSSVQVIALGPGDPAEGVMQATELAGRAALPPSPVHLTAQPDGAGGLAIRWIRRSRSGWDWRDAVDAPIAEEAERYSIVVTRADATERSFQTAEPRLALAAADRGAGAVSIAVRQIGTHGASPAAAITVAAE